MSLMALGYLAHPDGDKCFKVSRDDRGWSVFVWARFNAEARRHGANQLDSDWESVTCERFPRLDHFEGDLLSWCLEDGWWFSCSECEAPCYQQNSLIVRGDIFCSQAHADKYHAHWDRNRALEKRFAEYARKKYPEALVPRTSVNVDGDGIVYFSGEGCRLIARSDLGPEI